MDDRRRNERKKLNTFIPVYDCQRDRLLGYLGDLSSQGARLVGDEPLGIDREIVLAIGFPERPDPRTRRAIIVARVAWCLRDQNPEYFNVGFEFQDINPEHRAAVKAILDTVQLPRKVQ